MKTTRKKCLVTSCGCILILSACTEYISQEENLLPDESIGHTEPSEAREEPDVIAHEEDSSSAVPSEESDQTAVAEFDSEGAKPELLPDGTFVVIKPFSITTDYGIHGFPVGKEVKLIDDKGHILKITDGTIETEISREHLTNEKNISEEVFQTRDNARAAGIRIRQEVLTHMQSTIDSTNDLEIQRQRSVLQTNLSRAEASIAKIEKRLFEKQGQMKALRRKHGISSDTTEAKHNRPWRNSHERMRLEKEIPQLKSSLERAKRNRDDIQTRLHKLN